MATWKAVSCDYATEIDGNSNVINNVHWECTDIDDDECFGRVYGSVNIATDDLSSFIAYNDLTEEQVIAWAKAAIGDEEVAAIEANVAAQIAEQHNPTEGSGTPWAV
jgi:hypothetical protein